MLYFTVATYFSLRSSSSDEYMNISRKYHHSKVMDTLPNVPFGMDGRKSFNSGYNIPAFLLSPNKPVLLFPELSSSYIGGL